MLSEAAVMVVQQAVAGAWRRGTSLLRRSSVLPRGRRAGCTAALQLRRELTRQVGASRSTTRRCTHQGTQSTLLDCTAANAHAARAPDTAAPATGAASPVALPWPCSSCLGEQHLTAYAIGLGQGALAPRPRTDEGRKERDSNRGRERLAPRTLKKNRLCLLLGATRRPASPLNAESSMTVTRSRGNDQRETPRDAFLRAFYSPPR